MESGQDPSQFWRLTPREIDVILGGAVARIRREHNELAWAAWHTGMIGRAKKPPRLKDMMDDGRKRRRQTPQEIKAVVKAWMATG